jgi:hypothetical protein
MWDHGKYLGLVKEKKKKRKDTHAKALDNFFYMV